MHLIDKFLLYFTRELEANQKLLIQTGNLDSDCVIRWRFDSHKFQRITPHTSLASFDLQIGLVSI